MTPCPGTSQPQTRHSRADILGTRCLEGIEAWTPRLEVGTPMPQRPRPVSFGREDTVGTGGTKVSNDDQHQHQATTEGDKSRPPASGPTTAWTRTQSRTAR